MTAIKWTNAMSVGVDRLDRDHQMLIEMINRIASADDSEATRRRVIPEVLVTLIAYTVFHFQREERVMRAMAYPEADIHREEHMALTREVHLLQRRFSEKPNSISRDEVLTFLIEWLNHHILLQDMAYKPYCEGRPEAEQAAVAHGEFDLAKLLTPAPAAAGTPVAG
jgi:hemerythrin-like metal-binding protein